MKPPDILSKVDVRKRKPRPETVTTRWPRRTGRPPHGSGDALALETLHAIALIQRVTGRPAKRKEIGVVLSIKSISTVIARLHVLRHRGLVTFEVGSVLSLRLTLLGIRCLRRCPQCGHVGHWADEHRSASGLSEVGLSQAGLSEAGESIDPADIRDPIDQWINPSDEEIQRFGFRSDMPVDMWKAIPLPSHLKPLWAWHDCDSCGPKKIKFAVAEERRALFGGEESKIERIAREVEETRAARELKASAALEIRRSGEQKVIVA